MRIALIVLGTVLVGGQSEPPRQRPVDHATVPVFNRALGVDCVHCHTTSQWSDGGKPTFEVARRMVEMVRALNDRLQASGFDQVPVTCETCHAGTVRPPRLAAAMLDAELDRWPAALADRHPTLKLNMAVYSASLGVGCGHCHTADDWKSGEKQTFRTAQAMSALFAVFPKYLPKTARPQCYMCHQGNARPRSVAARPSRALERARDLSGRDASTASLRAR